MNYYITTDTHLGHNGIHKHRVEDYEERIIKHLKYTIQENDVLIHLGDVVFNDGNKWMEQLNSIPCRKWLVKGNHDKRTYTWYINNGFDFIGETINLKLYGYNILLSHVPQRLDNMTTIGSDLVESCIDINIHGHFHNTDHRSKDPYYNSLLCDKHYCLALEYNDYRPFKLDKLIKNFRNKKYVRNVLDE